MARAYSHGLDPSEPADYDAYVAQWRSHFQKCDENFELERGLNHIFAEDWVPSVEVIEDAIKASRRLNTWATAVRVLEALEDKVPKRAQYDQYLAHLQPLLEDLGVEEAKTLGTFEPIREKRWIDRD
ncbi:hypothetical protein CXG81DRAFT_10333 [Caulochytrium protostelioides]|uniref:Cytochrome c oxidase subunit 6, mitochondrial n=1 Tax=Caulochytrium protostelioides TaxID=1555241 RepID=A0A4P9WZ48_9FUNG|nr:cytochrome c oxidase subunit E [Caulochytrium protostelioides]RKP02821.1 hypothetical protein CXG81DRAFT_10333 [Caulochytrium protostelioides]|eukprot:RKP02821.1 hypothetical protein CXG81DRAFT_10333 [Caulochytrium protostelioides]